MVVPVSFVLELSFSADKDTKSWIFIAVRARVHLPRISIKPCVLVCSTPTIRHQVRVAKVSSLMFLFYFFICEIEIASVNNILHWHLTEVTPAFIFRPRRFCNFAFANERCPHAVWNCLSLSKSFKMMSFFSFGKLFSVPFPLRTACRLGRHFTYKAVQTLFNLYTKCHCWFLPWRWDFSPLLRLDG